MPLLFRMVWNEEMLYHLHFSSLLSNIPLGSFNKLELNDTHQLLVCSDDVNLLCKNVPLWKTLKSH